MDVLWRPSAQVVDAANITAYRRWLGGRGVRPGPEYDDLWRWSVDNLEEFWTSIWEYYQIEASTPYDAVLPHRAMPGAVWFPGARLNYAEHALRYDGGDMPALLAVKEDGAREVSWTQLRAEVASVAARFRLWGVGAGDRVVGYLPNVPAAVVAFLACASIGAVWSSCGPDFGTRSVIDRFGQIEPVVLIATDGYRYGGRVFDRLATVAEIRCKLPSVRHAVLVSTVDSGAAAGFTPWGELTADSTAECDFAQLPFDHPLWVLYSSGTTGLPKPIVHGHGGILLEHHKSLGLHFDLRPADRFYWYTSTSWIMWNILVAGLLHGATIVLYDGSPAYPSQDAQWSLAAEHGVTFLGTGAAYVAGCARAGRHPCDQLDLSAVRGIGVTGSPLPADAFRWVYDAVAPDVWLTSVSGGTDVATGFIKGAPVLPVHVGELQCRGLGVAMAAWDDGGSPVVDDVGELVVTQPMPSMPLYFWGDPDGSRYHESYFEMFPGVWRHGDFVTITARGTVVVHGRSDSTINRQGVRMGSADIYDAVERLPEVAESLVIGAELPDGGYYLPLYVVLAPGAVLDGDLRARINYTIRSEVSPRHVPDEIIEAPGVPHTLTGKRIEVPIKRLLQGHPVEGAVNLGALDRPELIDFYVDQARLLAQSRLSVDSSRG